MCGHTRGTRNYAGRLVARWLHKDTCRQHNMKRTIGKVQFLSGIETQKAVWQIKVNEALAITVFGTNCWFEYFVLFISKPHFRSWTKHLFFGYCFVVNKLVATAKWVWKNVQLCRIYVPNVFSEWVVDQSTIKLLMIESSDSSNKRMTLKLNVLTTVKAGRRNWQN